MTTTDFILVLMGFVGAFFLIPLAGKWFVNRSKISRPYSFLDQMTYRPFRGAHRGWWYRFHKFPKYPY